MKLIVEVERGVVQFTHPTTGRVLYCSTQAAGRWLQGLAPPKGPEGAKVPPLEAWTDNLAARGWASAKLGRPGEEMVEHVVEVDPPTTRTITWGVETGGEGATITCTFPPLVWYAAWRCVEHTRQIRAMLLWAAEEMPLALDAIVPGLQPFPYGNVGEPQPYLCWGHTGVRAKDLVSLPIIRAYFFQTPFNRHIYRGDRVFLGTDGKPLTWAEWVRRHPGDILPPERGRGGTSIHAALKDLFRDEAVRALGVGLEGGG